jgi:hypothetical protein
VVERVDLATDPGAIATGEAEVLQAALSPFYDEGPSTLPERSRGPRSGRQPPPEIDLPIEVEDAEAMEGMAVGTRRPAREARRPAPRRQACAR